jgi:uncharacterized protein (TIGR03086 family)
MRRNTVEIFDALDRAVTFAGGVVKGVPADQLTDPTPCTEWDVHALLNHLIGTVWLGEALLGDRTPRHAVAPGGLPAEDLVEGDPAAAYAASAAALLAAAGAGDTLTRAHQTPFGEMPGAVLASFFTLDVAVHGWDLATATGQAADLDPDLATHLLAFAESSITDETRAPRLGPALPPGPDATITDRLMAFLGRRA